MTVVCSWTQWLLKGHSKFIRGTTCADFFRIHFIYFAEFYSLVCEFKFVSTIFSYLVKNDSDRKIGITCELRIEILRKLTFLLRYTLSNYKFWNLKIVNLNLWVLSMVYNLHVPQIVEILEFQHSNFDQKLGFRKKPHWTNSTTLHHA